MNILVISDKYPPYYEGGYEINCEVAVRELVRRGHTVTVLTSDFGMSGETGDDVLRILHDLPQSSASGWCRRGQQIRNAYFGRRNLAITREVLHRIKPDIAYIWRMGGVSIYPVRAVQRLAVPTVFELEDYWLLDNKRDFIDEPKPLKRWVRSLLFGGFAFRKIRLDNLVFISEALKRHYLARRIDGTNVTVMPRGIPRQIVGKPPLPKNHRWMDTVRLLYAGRIVEEKGVHIAVAAMDVLENHWKICNVKLDIIGSGRADYVESIVTDVSAKGLNDQITFKGQVTRQELMELYGDYDIFLFTSLWDEPFGNTILEAMAGGLPVVASRVGAVPEIITEGKNGVIVTAGDPEMLASAVCRLIRDPELFARLRESGFKTVTETFDCSRIMDRLEDYLSALSAGGECRPVPCCLPAEEGTAP